MPTTHTTYFTHISSPVGTLMIAASDEGLHAVEFPQSQHPVPRRGTWQALAPHILKSFSDDSAAPTASSRALEHHASNNRSNAQPSEPTPCSTAPQSPGNTALRRPGGANMPSTSMQPPRDTDMLPPNMHVISLLIKTQQQLDEYFAGQRQQFELPLAPQGTPFQLQVWQALSAIPYGKTWSYAQLAEHIGNPRSVRAVGAANGKNPIAIIIPCHRVIGANGSLVGFGGGLATKEKLLVLESSQHSLALGE